MTILAVLLCWILPDTALLLRAQERETRTRISVLFPINRYVLLRDYADNASALDALDRQLLEDNPAGINLVVIISAASPEGPTTFNEMLSKRRGEALRSYVLAQRPDLEDKIELRSVGEAWVELHIVDLGLSPAEREKALRSRSDWRSIVRKKLPPLRYAFLDITRAALPSETLCMPVLSQPVEMLSIPQVTPVTATRSIQPVLGLSTNLLYDLTYVPHYGLTSIPSFSLEYYPRRGHWTVGADVEWPMWQHYENHRFLQVNNITLWTRRYFKPTDGRFGGAYLLLNANVARYGIGWDAKGWEGEGIGASLGAGYKLNLGKRMFLDFGLALGAFYSPYDPYVYGFDSTGRYYYDYNGDVDKFVARSKRLMWMGPTRAYISLGIDLFNRKRR